jgi:CelD/BcsL family acetyltransferase involved in cellulose biosynthesis
MKFVLVSSTDQFAALAEPWNELVARSASNNIFLTWEWQFSWWQAYGGSRRLCILLAYDDDGRLAGIAPLYRHAVFQGPLRFRTLEFIGGRHVASEYLDFIAVADRQSTIVDAMIADLRARGETGLLLGFHMPCESPTLEALNAPRLSNTWTETLQTESLYVTAPDWDTYLAGLGKLTRRNVRYYRKNAVNDLGVRLVDLRCGLADALPTLIELHQKRMRQLGYPGSYASAAFVSFHDHVARRFEAKGWGRMFALAIGDQTIAANYGFVYNGTFYDYSMGFDPAFRDHSIGFVLFSHMLETCITEGLRADFLDPGRYKELWKPERRLKLSYACATSPRALSTYTTATHLRARLVASAKRMLPEPAALRLATWKDSVVSRISSSF